MDLCRKKIKIRFVGSQRGRVAGSRPRGPRGQISRGLGARAPGIGVRPARSLGPFPIKITQISQITIFRNSPGGSLATAWLSAETAASEAGTWREMKPGYPAYPPPSPPPPPRVLGLKGKKEEDFRPLCLRQSSNTPPKVGGSRRF